MMASPGGVRRGTGATADDKIPQCREAISSYVLCSADTKNLFGFRNPSCRGRQQDGMAVQERGSQADNSLQKSRNS